MRSQPNRQKFSGASDCSTSQFFACQSPLSLHIVKKNSADRSLSFTLKQKVNLQGAWTVTILLSQFAAMPVLNLGRDCVKLALSCHSKLAKSVLLVAL